MSAGARNEVRASGDDMAATSEQRSTVVGAFEDRHRADTAISELRQAGFREDQIAVEEARSVGGSESDRTTVTVTAEGRYDEATALLRRHGAYDLRTTAHASRTAEGAERLRVRKEIVTEDRTLEVPVQREEVVIERHTPTGEPGASDLRPGEEIRVPVRKEQVTVEKRPVVKEEVTVGKRVVQGTEQVGGEVHREEVRVEREGDVDVRGGEPDQK